MNNDFFVENDDVIVARSKSGVELLPLEVASRLRKNLIQKYSGKLDNYINHDYAAAFEKHPPTGYFIYVAPDNREAEPISTCFHISEAGFSQYVHNIVVVDKNSTLSLRADCNADDDSAEAAHYAMSEIYLEDGATLNLTMVHDWGEGTLVRPITAIKAGKNCQINYQYICTNAPADISSDPAFVLGEGSSCHSQTVAIVRAGANCDYGGTVHLNGENSRSTITSKVVSTGGKAVSRASITARHSSASGHAECDGLIIDKEGTVESIPILNSIKCQAELSHETAIGKIKPETLEYIMSRGISEDEATRLVVTGFMDVNRLDDDLTRQVMPKINEIFSNVDSM